jgi:hypothetical protein
MGGLLGDFDDLFPLGLANAGKLSILAEFHHIENQPLEART